MYFLPRCWWYDGHVTDGVCFKAVNSAVTDQGLIFGETTIYPPTNSNDYCIHIFSILFFLFFVVNKITPLRVSEDKEELGLDISQHGEFL
jgi:Amt family ammonium transporter